MGVLDGAELLCPIRPLIRNHAPKAVFNHEVLTLGLTVSLSPMSRCHAELDAHDLHQRLPKVRRELAVTIADDHVW